MNNESLGPAERIINTLLNNSQHAYHGRPGVVVKDSAYPTGVKWFPVTHAVEDGKKIVYSISKVGNRTTKVKFGEMREDLSVVNPAGNVIGEYRKPGLFPEVATWLYNQVAEVWKIDNEFSARWASYAYEQDHRDMKVALTAFMLVQSRKGDPIKDENDLFYDDDYRDVGEAMMLLLSRKDKKDLNPKMLLRVYDMLSLPGIAKINRDLGFGKSARKPFYGRWNKAVEKWLRFREDNTKLLEGLTKAGFRQTVMELSRRVGYKPTTSKFFETLRWKQVQSKDGRREMAIGKEVTKAETWEDLDEKEICEYIVKNRPKFKRITGLLTSKIGLTRAIMTAAIESDSLSFKDLIIMTPTLEDLGLLDVQNIRDKWQEATQKATDMRALNISKRVKSKEVKEQLEEASTNVVKKAVEKEMNDIRMYLIVDRSGSMQGAIDKAKVLLEKFLQAIPEDRIHISVFNHYSQEIVLKRPTAAGVRQAFTGITACGGTDYGSGIRALQHHKPKPGEDVIFFFVGDEIAHDFVPAVTASGLNPTAFGFVKIESPMYSQYNIAYFAVQNTARTLGIPCFMVNENTFEDPYSIPRTISNLISSTPVNRNHGGATVTPIVRETLLDKIVKTKLLAKPIWAA